MYDFYKEKIQTVYVKNRMSYTILLLWLSCGILYCSKAREEDVKCTVVIFTIMELNTTQSSFFISYNVQKNS